MALSAVNKLRNYELLYTIYLYYERHEKPIEQSKKVSGGSILSAHSIGCNDHNGSGIFQPVKYTGSLDICP